MLWIRFVAIATIMLTRRKIIDIVAAVAESGDERQYASAPVNLHVFSQGCSEIERMVRFRDWLRTSRDARESYARAKRALAEQEWKYTQNYADTKSTVVEEIMSRALRDSVG
jgi:GrpB-like predicted nucleotidyltransferase (UPF0157 family)